MARARPGGREIEGVRSSSCCSTRSPFPTSWRARDRCRPDGAVSRARCPWTWPPGDAAPTCHLEDWVREVRSIDPDRVRGMESEDLAWLRAGEGEGHIEGPGAWPFAINAFGAARTTISSSGSRRSGRSSPATRSPTSSMGWTSSSSISGRDARRCRPTASSAARSPGRAPAARTRRAGDGSRGARARALVSGAGRIRGSRDVAPSCANVLSLRFGGDSAAHGGIQRALPGCARIRRDDRRGRNHDRPGGLGGTFRSSPGGARAARARVSAVLPQATMMRASSALNGE